MDLIAASTDGQAHTRTHVLLVLTITILGSNSDGLAHRGGDLNPDPLLVEH